MHGQSCVYNRACADACACVGCMRATQDLPVGLLVPGSQLLRDRWQRQHAQPEARSWLAIAVTP